MKENPRNPSYDEAVEWARPIADVASNGVRHKKDFSSIGLTVEQADADKALGYASEAFTKGRSVHPTCAYCCSPSSC